MGFCAFFASNCLRSASARFSAKISRLMLDIFLNISLNNPITLPFPSYLSATHEDSLLSGMVGKVSVISLEEVA